MEITANSAESATNQGPRILLIGSHGQVGYELRRSLRPLGEIFCAARKPAVGELAIDLTDGTSIVRTIREVRPRLIINAAAYTLVDQAEKEPDLAQAINGTASGAIQTAANEIGAAVVHYSTDYVFDGSGDSPWSETDAVGPLGVYGASKLAGEQAVAAAGGSYLILRTSWVYGVHGANFVKKILALARDREQLRIVADQHGAPTSARVIADVTAQMLAQSQGDFRDLMSQRGGIYHLCCAGTTTWHGFTEAIVSRARRVGMSLKVGSIDPIPTSAFPTPARRPLNSRLSCRRLQHDYALFPPAWQAALDDTLSSLIAQEFGVRSDRA